MNSNKLLLSQEPDLAKATGILGSNFLSPGKAPTRLFFSSLTTVRVPEIDCWVSFKLRDVILCLYSLFFTFYFSDRLDNLCGLASIQLLKVLSLLFDPQTMTFFPGLIPMLNSTAGLIGQICSALSTSSGGCVASGKGLSQFILPSQQQSYMMPLLNVATSNQS